MRSNETDRRGWDLQEFGDEMVNLGSRLKPAYTVDTELALDEMIELGAFQGSAAMASLRSRSLPGTSLCAGIDSMLLLNSSSSAGLIETP